MEKTVFNSNDPGLDNGNYFGLPFTLEEARVVLLSAPWDVTSSYKAGSSEGPCSIRKASLQVDLFDLQFGKVWEKGIGTADMNEKLFDLSKKHRPEAEKIISYLEKGDSRDVPKISTLLEKVNTACEKMNMIIYKQSKSLLADEKLIGLVGGDHSVPLGYLQALAEIHPSFGILHIDAHADLRDSYEGFKYSHASIMHNALKIDEIERIVQVGIRDVCEDEVRLVESEPRIRQFTDFDINDSLYNGVSWKQISRNIIACLPEKVYISFDVDGLNPSLCPNTGTPVPGGMNFEQTTFLLSELSKSGKQLIGFDLCEVAPGNDNDWDANVGGRLLFKLSMLLCTMI